jgi:hypothetical protein
MVPTGRWAVVGHPTLARGESVLDMVLDGVGDESRQREFRMATTLCRHRALTPAEKAGLPEWWQEAPALDVAGGPLEVLWHRGIPETLSTQPCRNPRKRPLPDGTLTDELFLVGECGECETCVDRDRRAA